MPPLSACRCRPSSRGWLGVFLCAALGGCVVDASGRGPLPAPSRTTFAEEAGPILARRCGDYACHATADRPFALLAVGRRRLASADQYTAHPLTPAEWDANYWATLGFLDAPRGRDTTLLHKALAVGGSGGHKGGAVFAAASDPECQAVLAWIAGTP